MECKVGDWVVLDLKIGQVTDIHDGGARFCDGSFETSGRLLDRFRPLTLKNKAIIENFDIYYNRLHEIDGNAGFNYPDISSYFAHLAREAIDSDSSHAAYQKVQEFIRDARDYKPLIQGIRLFRPEIRRVAC